MLKVVAFIVLLFAIFYNSESLFKLIKGKVALDPPASVQRYNKEILGEDYFKQNIKEATEVYASCILNEQWKYEENTKVYLRNCFDATAVVKSE